MPRASIVTPLAFGLVLSLGCASAMPGAPCTEGECRAGPPSSAPSDAVACGPTDAAAGPGAACPADCDTCDGGVCRIVCAAGSACDGQTVACAPGMDCAVSCVGDAACKSATIVGPSGFALDVDCHGRASCGGMVVDSGRDLEVSCEGAKACGRATLRCGDGECDWLCATAGSCEDIAVE